MIKTGRWSLFWGVFALLFFSITEAKVNVQATVDRNSIGQRDTFILTVAVSSDDSVSISDPRLPSLNGFQLMQSWSGTEARSVFANGKFQTTRTRKFNYQLSPRKKGKLRIGHVEVIVNGKPYKTKVIDIKVSEGGGQAARPQRRANPFGRAFPGNDPFAEVDDLFNQLLGRRGGGGNRGGGSAVQPSISDKDLFSIEVEVDKKEVYAGEQVTATWYLYTRGQVRDIDTLKYPSLNGFWKEDIQVATHLNFQNEINNGVVYKKALLASYALFPIKPGAITIDPYEAKITALNPRQGIGFGFGKPVTATKKSRVVSVEVLPLPEGAPPSFTGAVGQYEVSAKVDENQVPANQPISLKVRFEGRGNAKLIELPKLALPSEVEVYDTKSQSKFYKSGKSYKEFEVLLIPRKEGSYQIPTMAFAIFDPIQKEYVFKETSPIDLIIEKGEANPNEKTLAVVSDKKEEIKKEPTLEPLLEWKSYAPAGFSLGEGNTFTLLGVLMSLLLAFKAKKELFQAQEKKDLVSLVKGRFVVVQQALKKGELREVGVQMVNASYLALGGVTGDGGAHQEIGKLLLKVPPSLRREVGEELEKLMDFFQIIGFAPEEMIEKFKDKKELKQKVKEMEKIILKVARSRSGSSKEEL